MTKTPKKEANSPKNSHFSTKLPHFGLIFTIFGLIHPQFQAKKIWKLEGVALGTRGTQICGTTNILSQIIWDHKILGHEYFRPKISWDLNFGSRVFWASKPNFLKISLALRKIALTEFLIGVFYCENHFFGHRGEIPRKILKSVKCCLKTQFLTRNRNPNKSGPKIKFWALNSATWLPSSISREARSRRGCNPLLELLPRDEQDLVGSRSSILRRRRRWENEIRARLVRTGGGGGILVAVQRSKPLLIFEGNTDEQSRYETVRKIARGMRTRIFA